MIHNRTYLIVDWHRVLLRAWSARLLYLGFGFQILEQLLPYFDPDSYGIPPQAFRLVTTIILVGAVWARVFPQPDIHLEKINANQQDPAKQAWKSRHRRSYAKRCRDFLVRFFFPGTSNSDHCP